MGSKSTRSVSYHHFGWAFPSSAKSRIDEYRQLEFKTRFSTFTIGAKRKNTLVIEFHELGFIPSFWVGFSKQRKKAKLTNIVKLSSKRVFRLSQSGRNEKKPLGSISTRSVSYHHFGWAFPSSAKSRIDEYRQIEFKRVFRLSPSGKTKKHPWDRNPRCLFHTTILGELFQAAQKAELTNIVKLSSKRVFRLSPSGRNEKTPLGSVSYHYYGWDFTSNAKSGIDDYRPIEFKTRFSTFPIGAKEKTPLGSKSTRSVSYHHFGWAFPSSAKSRIDEYRQLEFKTRFSTFTIGAKRKNTLGIEFHEFGFIPSFWVGFSKQRKKAKLTNIVNLSSKRVFRLSPSGRNEKKPLGSISTRSVSYHHFGWAFPSRAKSRIDEYRQIEFKTRFSTFPIGANEKTPLGSNSTS